MLCKRYTFRVDKNGHKFCYMGHTKWLPEGHPFRYDDVGFDGKVELGYAPKPTSGKVFYNN